MAKDISNDSTEIDRLRRENTILKSKISNIEHEQPNTGHHLANSIFRWTLLTMAGLVYLLGSVMIYISMTLTNTDRFMAVAGPLIEKPSIQQAIADKTTTALFEQIDLESLAVEVLPPKVDFLAPTIATQIEKFTEDEANKILASDNFESVWYASLRTAHSTLIENIKQYEGDGVVSLQDVFDGLTERLQSPKLAFLQGKTLPEKIGNITIIEVEWLPEARLFVNYVNTVRIIIILFFILLLAAVVKISRNRRRAFIQIGSMITALSVLMILMLQSAISVVVTSAQPEYRSAVSDAWLVITYPFIVQLILFIVIGVGLVIVAWIDGNSRSAVKVKYLIDDIFSQKLHRAVFSKENALTTFIGSNKRRLMAIVGICLLLSLLFIRMPLQEVAYLIILAIILIGFIEFLASVTKKS